MNTTLPHKDEFPIKPLPHPELRPVPQFPKTLNMKRIAKIMIEIVRGALGAIAQHAHNPIPVAKLGYDQAEGEEPDDMATQGDAEAQAHYLRCISAERIFRGFGIICEEDNLRIPCTHPDFDAYITIDPLDGTKAYYRGQSHGVGSMVSIVVNGQVAAAFIGDANTMEVFAFAKECVEGKVSDTCSMKPCRNYANGIVRILPEAFALKANAGKKLTQRYLLLRDAPHMLPDIIQDMIRGAAYTPALFKNIEVAGGSIGLSMARLWKREIGAVVLNPKHQTPWDSAPVIGFNQALGYKVFRYAPDSDTLFAEFDEPIITEVTKDAYIAIIIHEDDAPQLQEWIARSTWQED